MCSENEPDNAPLCNICSARKSTHRCYVCGKFICQKCVAPCNAGPISSLLTDDQTDSFFNAIQVRCIHCGKQ